MAGEHDQLNIDPNLLQDFLSESTEALGGVEELLVQLEGDPENYALIDRIFRPVHSVKGNSSFFGLVNIKNFSHALENLLQDLRSRSRRATREVSDALLKGVDMLRNMVNRLASGDTSTALLPPEEELIAVITKMREKKELGEPELLAAAAGAIDKLRPLCTGGEAAAALDAIVKAIEASLQRVSPAAAKGGEVHYSIGETDCTEIAARAASFSTAISVNSTQPEQSENFISDLQALQNLAEASGKSPLAKEFGEVRDSFQTIYHSGIGFDEMLSSLITEKLDSAFKGLTRHAGTAPAAGQAAAPAEAAAPAAASAPAPAAPAAAPAEGQPAAAAHAPGGEEGQSKTIRIAEEKVDNFMNFVGELITVSEVFSYLQKKLEHINEARQISAEFKKALLDFNDLSLNLQKSLMEVRRVALKAVMQKLPRMIRDLAKDLGKQVKLEIDGDNIQIDKSLIEKLESPITHMVRNSVDHGIEMPDARVAADKPAVGTIKVHAECTEELFTLVIKDDGHGLDVNRLKKKAVERKLITPEEAAVMPDKEAFLLIFNPGLSTAEKVTEVSGRGVGMDVVRTNIQEMNGVIEVDSDLGKGTTITLTMPMAMTLLVVDGLLAQVGNQTYVIPLTQVNESLRPSKADISTVSGKGEMVNVRGKLYPIVRLHNLFRVTPRKTDPCDTVIVLVETEDAACGLMVDELLGQQSVVLKDLSDYFNGLNIIRGGAILGSGQVGLVLDVEGIMTQAVRVKK